MKYTLTQHTLFPNEKALCEDEKILNCPFQNPIGIPGKLQGQVSLVPMACGTWCALFEQQNNVVRLTCSDSRKVLLEKETVKESPLIVKG